MSHSCERWGKKGWSLHTTQEAHQAGVYPGFHSMKWLKVFLLLPGWDTNPSPGYPPALKSLVPIYMYTPGWREALRELRVLPKNTTQCPWSGLEPGPHDPQTRALTLRTQCLHKVRSKPLHVIPSRAAWNRTPVNNVTCTFTYIPDGKKNPNKYNYT